MNAPLTLPAKTGDIVTVACKLPHGIYLDIYSDDVVPGAAPEILERMKINGTNSSALELVGGHALTLGVPRELWERWLKANTRKPFVKNGLVFAHSKVESVRAEAMDKRNTRTGFEGLNPDTDRTLGVTRADEQPAHAALNGQINVNLSGLRPNL